MRRWRVWVLIVGLAVMIAAGKVIGDDAYKSKLYAEGRAAESAQQWVEAFARYRELTERDPDYRDANNRLATVAQQLEIIPIENLDPRIEITWLHWLAASGDKTRLAQVLDQRVIRVSAGEFLMGSDTVRADERPQRLIYLDAYEIDRYEVTNAQYQRFVQASGTLPPRYWLAETFPPGQSDFPIVGVSWENADAYCAWLNQRLPTEAEWEKACRGVDGRLYPWGNEWEPSRANVDERVRPLRSINQEVYPWDDAWALLSAQPSSAVPRLAPIGSYPESISPYGMMDAVGNASEWVADWYNWTGYSDLPDRNPRGLEPPWNHCLRGSAWYDPHGAKGWAQDLSRCSARNSSHETVDPRVGFRCARSITTP